MLCCSVGFVPTTEIKQHIDLKLLANFKENAYRNVKALDALEDSHFTGNGNRQE
jgi:hypothetical protein